MDYPDYISHHGIKGQKWGIRRYQNSDGSLTDEGRRRYGFGKGAGRLMTKNTKSRAIQGVKLGAKLGAGAGVAASVVGGAALVSAGVPAAAALGMGAAYLASYTASGALNGLKYGLIFGAAETAMGRNYIKQYDTGLSEFEMRDLNRKTKVDHGKNVTIVS